MCTKEKAYLFSLYRLLEVLGDTRDLGCGDTIWRSLPVLIAATLAI